MHGSDDEGAVRPDERDGEVRHQIDRPLQILILLGGVLAAMTLSGINSVLPKIGDALAHGPGDAMLVKQLVGAVALAMVVGSPLAGYLAERWGLRSVLRVAVPLYVLAGTAGLYLSDLKLLLVSRLLVGLAAASILICCLILINTRLPAAIRPRWMGFHISIAMIGTIVVQPLAGVLGEWSWRGPFALFGLGLVLLPALYGKAAEAPHLQLKAGGSKREEAATALPFYRWFPLHYLLLAIMIGSIVFLPMVYTPFILRERGVASPAIISLVLSADSMAGAGMAMLYGRARKRLTIYGAFAFSFACTGLGTAVAAVSGGFMGIFVGLLIYGFGVGWFVPNLMTAIAERIELQYRARATGFVKAAHFLAAPLCVVLIDPIARKFGPDTILVAAAGLSLSLLITVAVKVGLGAAALTNFASVKGLEA